MGQLLNASIDLTKIDKSKITEGKNGGKFYPVTIAVNDTPDQYGKDVQIWEQQSKEQRDARENRRFIGSGWASGGKPASTAPAASPAPVAAQDDDYSDLPF